MGGGTGPVVLEGEHAIQELAVSPHRHTHRLGVRAVGAAVRVEPVPLGQQSVGQRPNRLGDQVLRAPHSGIWVVDELDL